jgi:hypothetical protein
MANFGQFFLPRRGGLKAAGTGVKLNKSINQSINQFTLLKPKMLHLHQQGLVARISFT